MLFVGTGIIEVIPEPVAKCPDYRVRPDFKQELDVFLVIPSACEESRHQQREVFPLADTQATFFLYKARLTSFIIHSCKPCPANAAF